MYLLVWALFELCFEMLKNEMKRTINERENQFKKYINSERYNYNTIYIQMTTIVAGRTPI